MEKVEKIGKGFLSLHEADSDIDSLVNEENVTINMIVDMLIRHLDAKKEDTVEKLCDLTGLNREAILELSRADPNDSLFTDFGLDKDELYEHIEEDLAVTVLDVVLNRLVIYKVRFPMVAKGRVFVEKISKFLDTYKVACEK